MMESIEAGNMNRALETAEKLIGEDEEAFFPYLMRAVSLCYMKEDGKALMDWKNAISRMERNEHTDAYVCIIANSVSDLIIADELEFIDFDYTDHMDRICEALDEKLGCSCKGFVYMTLFTCFMSSYLGMEEEQRNLCAEVVANLVQRTVAYSRDVNVVKDVISEYLGISDYDEATYEDDETYRQHSLSEISKSIDRNLPGVDKDEFPGKWTDAEMKNVLDGYLAAILACKEDDKPLEKYAKKGDAMPDLEHAIEDYARKYLRIR